MDDDETKRMFDDLVPIIDEEPCVALALGRSGAIETPSLDRIRGVAGLIADEVVRYLASRAPRSN